MIYNMLGIKYNMQMMEKSTSLFGEVMNLIRKDIRVAPGVVVKDNSRR